MKVVISRSVACPIDYARVRVEARRRGLSFNGVLSLWSTQLPVCITSFSHLRTRVEEYRKLSVTETGQGCVALITDYFAESHNKAKVDWQLFLLLYGQWAGDQIGFRPECFHAFFFICTRKLHIFLAAESWYDIFKGRLRFCANIWFGILIIVPRRLRWLRYPLIHQIRTFSPAKF